MELTEKILDSKYLYQGKIINMRLDTVQLPNGNTAKREIVEHSGGVCVLPVEGDMVYFVRQYRHPYGEVILELPAGKVNPGEDPDECGRRELQEEIGCTAGKYRPLGKLYPSPGYVTEVIHLFLAEDLQFTRQNLDPDEFLDVVKLPLSQAYEMIAHGELLDAKTQIALFRYQQMAAGKE